MKRRSTTFLMMFLLAASSAMAHAHAKLVEAVDFGSNPGHLQMFYYVPPSLPADAPLVVVAHGCLQTAQEMADTSGWVELATKYHFALLFPQTSKANEPWAGCFRTWEPAQQVRGAGEPLSVWQMIEHMRVLFPLSKTRTYITGVSSGGHLTNEMLATYPDVFAAGAPESSFPYKCAMSAKDLATCAAGKRHYTAKQWGDLVRSGDPGYAGPWPRVQIWHGGQDPVIKPVNQHLEALQWTNVHGIDASQGQKDELLSQPRISYRAKDGEVMVQTITVRGMKHGIAVDPGTGPGQCGTTGPYAHAAGICAAYWIGKFFGVVH